MGTNKKFTEDYADGLAEQLYLTDVLESYETRAYKQGYIKAIEETAANDMLKALIEVRKHMTAHIPEKVFDLIDNAINKATK